MIVCYLHKHAGCYFMPCSVWRHYGQGWLFFRSTSCSTWWYYSVVLKSLKLIFVQCDELLFALLNLCLHLITDLSFVLFSCEILTDSQHGFRARRTCETQLLLIADELISGLDKKYQHDLIISDFSKAFDCVPHECLTWKLKDSGIWGKVHRTDLNRCRLRKLPEVVSGVPQGTVWGRLAFLLFINDLPDSVHLSTRLFANHCVLYWRIKGHRDCDILQDDLNQLASWEKK